MKDDQSDLTRGCIPRLMVSRFLALEIMLNGTEAGPPAPLFEIKLYELSPSTARPVHSADHNTLLGAQFGRIKRGGVWRGKVTLCGGQAA